MKRNSMQSVIGGNDGRFPFDIAMRDRSAQTKLFDDDPRSGEIPQLLDRNRCDRVALLGGRHGPLLGG
jgi:hypothetical protein